MLNCPPRRPSKGIYPRWVLTDITKGLTVFSNIVYVKLNLPREKQRALLSGESKLIENHGRGPDEADKCKKEGHVPEHSLVCLPVLFFGVNLGRCGAAKTNHDYFRMF